MAAVSNNYFNATVFYSYQVCPRQAWFYYHHLHPPTDHPLLALGRLVHEVSYNRTRKEVFVDNLLKIDLIKGQLIAEVKRSSRYRRAAELQLAYYLYYLKKEKGIELEGVLLFPKERKSEKLQLSPPLETKIENLLREIKAIASLERPPSAAKIPFCRSCSFMEICWG